MSGTNGKTTTTKLLAAAVASQGPVVTNLLGANLPTGLVTALAAGPPGAPAVLEVDEAWLARVALRLRRRVRGPAQPEPGPTGPQQRGPPSGAALAQTCEEALPTAVVVANADDPLVAWAASGAEARDVGGGRASLEGRRHRVPGMRWPGRVRPEDDAAGLRSGAP